MAITINDSPAYGAMPVYNPIGYSVSSTNTAQSNFKYVCDVYPAGATSPIRKKQPVDPNNGYCYFDVAGILKDYITSNPANGITYPFADCTNSYKLYTVKFGEEYGASSATTVYPNLATASGVAWNGSFPFDEWAENEHGSYYTVGATRKFLTSHPGSSTTPIKIASGEAYSLYFLNGATTAYSVAIQTYNSAGVTQNIVVYQSGYSTNNKLLRVGAGLLDLESIDGSEPGFTATAGLPVVSANVDYYTITLSSITSSQLTKSMRFKIVEHCSKHPTYRVQFMNKQGGYDMFTFTGAPKKTAAIERSHFKKQLGAWTGNQYLYDSTQRSKTQHNTVIQDSIKLVSGWITEDESTWLEELVSSPDVSYMNSFGEYMPCIITDSSYDYKTTARDVLFNLEITIQPSFNRYRQQS
jgi:hypothetical protein